MRILVLLLLVAIIVMIIWALRRRSEQSSGDAGDRYRVVETTGGAEAHVFLQAGARESRVLVGSVPITSPDFDERYGQLVAQAEDRAATLNASRELRA